MKASNQTALLMNKYNSSYKYKGYEINKPIIMRTNSGRIKTNKLIFSLDELKQAEVSDYWHLKVDKDRIVHQILSSKQVLLRLKEDYGHYFDKTNNRETQIRKHIDNLDYVYAESIDKVKVDIAGLIEDVNSNITVIEQKMKYDMEEKKRDIENRLNIRLMDSEYSHRNLLENKIKEQETFMRTLHSFTTEIIKIQNNYKKSKNQVISLLVNNEVLEENIRKNKRISQKLLKEMTNLKSVIFSIKNEIYLVYKLKNEENIVKSKEELFKNKLKKIKERNVYNNDSERLIKNSENLRNSNNNKISVLNKLNTSGSKRYIKNSFSKINFNNPLKINSSSQIDLNNIHKNKYPLLKNYPAENFIECMRDNSIYIDIINKFPRIDKALKHLCNIMFGLQNKIMKMKNQINYKEETSNILKTTVMNITQEIKKKNFKENNDKIPEIKEIYIDKNIRKRFINSLVSNQDIINLFNDERFPNITISHRQLGS